MSPLFMRNGLVALALVLSACSLGAGVPSPVETVVPGARPSSTPSREAAPSPRPVARALWPPVFASVPGWFLSSSGPVGSHRELAPFSAASTIPFENRSRMWPTGTAKLLPVGGVVLLVSVVGRPPQRANVNFPERRLPLHISDFTIEHSWEGQVAPNVPEYRLGFSRSRQLVDVRIWFGAQHPAPFALELAQRELDTLVVPSGITRPATTGPSHPCPIPGPGGYDPILSRNYGAAGSNFTVTGAVPTNSKSGHYDGPRDRIQFWWNLDPARYWTIIAKNATPAPAEPGPVSMLGVRHRSRHCAYRLGLIVPNVSPGSYTVAAVQTGGGGGTLMNRLAFQVTPAAT